MKDGRTDGWKEVRTDGRTDGRTDRRTDGGKEGQGITSMKEGRTEEKQVKEGSKEGMKGGEEKKVKEGRKVKAGR